ncbi:MAG: biotin transporter BioY [Lachnospiraceae bacterium]|nr:biotin transporter BioY [Lachnospiraceae bacterium]
MKNTPKRAGSDFTAHELTYIALAAALLTICAWIAIPFGDVPITLQTFAVLVIAGLFGTRSGLLALGVYLLMGMVGLPVFSGMTGGLGRLLGPTGGYLIGFFFTIPIVSEMAARFGRKPFPLALSMALGLLACYCFGTIWFAGVYMGSLDMAGIGTALVKCVVPFLLPDGVKLTMAMWIVRRLSFLCDLT